MPVCENPRLIPLFSKSRLLRRRRRVGFVNRIAPVSYRAWNRVYDVNSTIELVMVREPKERSRARRRRLKRLARRRARRRIPPNPSQIKQSRLSKIMDGLYIALVPEEGRPCELRTFDGERFTHIVRIKFDGWFWDEDADLETWTILESGQGAQVRRLVLTCPSLYFYLSPEQTAIEASQLLAAREFLSLALPYGGEKWWPKELHEDLGLERETPFEVSFCVEDEEDEEQKNIQVACLARHCILDEILTEFAPREEERETKERREEDDKKKQANVLILAPAKRAVDVLSVLFCYLSYLEDSTLDELAKKGYLDNAWDDVPLGGSSKFYVEAAAKVDPEFGSEPYSGFWYQDVWFH